jgi:protein SMG7
MLKIWMMKRKMRLFGIPGMINLFCMIILKVLHITLLRGNINISPTVSPSVLATPITAVKPMLSPKNVASRSSNPPAPAAPVVPPTTAQDLLNDVINFGAGGGSGRTLSGLSESTAPQPPFLFGSELSHRPSQSIWSASRDEQPLLYSGNGSASSGQIYQTSPRQFAAVMSPPSQDLSQKSIWPSSFSSHQSQNSQQYLIGALPSESFAQPPHSTLIGGSGHHRQSSSSMTAQLFPAQSLAPSDPFVYASPTLQHRQALLGVKSQLLPPTSSDYLNSSVFGGVTAADVAAQYYTTTTSGGSPSYQHSRQVSMHDPRHDYLSPPMSQMWSNMG